MLEWIEKFKTEILASLSLVSGFLIGRRRNNAEAESSEADAEKKKAEEDAIRLKTMLDLQNGLADLQIKFDAMYEAGETRRNANRAEQERLSQAVSDLSVRNSAQADQLQKTTSANFERELAYTNRIAELERKIDQQQTRVETIEKKTGSLENKMPKRE